MTGSEKFMIFIFKIIPQNLISRLFGLITRVPFPQFMLKPVIAWYSRVFKVKDEYITPAGGFRTFNDFFTRALTPDVRVIDKNKKSIISPVDARIDQFGPIRGDSIIQAKGLDYTLHDLIPSAMAEHFPGGDFVTLYLSPADYHRIHAPVGGKITGYHYIPGRLFTVQDYMVRGLRGLFSRNERLITYIDCGGRPVAVCKIGAFNVGRISASYENVIANKNLRFKKERHYSPAEQKTIARAGEIGRFNLGSTVIILFPPGFAKLNKLKTGSSVKLGQAIGSLL